MTDLTTTYLGLKLRNPLLVSASPLSENIDNLKRMEAAGASAVVLYSLFEEQIELQNMGASVQQKESLPDNLQHLSDMPGFEGGASHYLSQVYRAKRAVNIPIIGSLNGYYSSGWTQYARLIEAAGADALELNVYYLATNPNSKGHEIEEMYLKLIRNIKATVSIPVAVKISPYFSAMANIAIQMEQAGADGLVLFNRFYQPDFDLETETIVPSLNFSTSQELRLRLRWTAVLSGLLKSDLAITGGVHTTADVVKSLMAGAKVTMLASALLQNGIDHLEHLRVGLSMWLEEHGYDSIEAITGRMNQKNSKETAALERANYLRVLKTRRYEE